MTSEPNRQSREANSVTRELLIREVGIGLRQADEGKASALDVDALVEQTTARLAEEGIVD